MDLPVKALDGPLKLSTTVISGREQESYIFSLHHAADAVPGTLSVVLNWTLVIVEAFVSVEST